MANYFPRWTNLLPLKIAICVGSVVGGLVLAFTYYATPKTQRVGYQPSQPIPYDHELHVKQLGLDCRHCHSFVEESGHANVPSANTCWNCHRHVKTDSERLVPLRRAIDPTYEGYTGEPVKWVRVHRSPDYVFFDHSAHLSRGISCVSCHGQVNEMPEVYHAKSLSMDMCITCHRSPEEHIRPLEEVTNLDFIAKDYISARPELAEEIEKFSAEHDLKLKPHGSQKEAQVALGSLLKHKWSVQPKESCFTCHR
ncbi:Cytochrome c7 [Rubritalea squalenifaciens DSM 18772]|uniref:Cytochrome c7 n=1 Tax=Rubritalea squalenifaciens DSM 18772 TaxID=1123071 RepID=A0A1M6P5M1_9BACT|nr:cytochrome c3 family protein [Rubritalea squalenifaciens]SHK03228.1 Cytochrome c7 [Rubritalea squalenifaciens DSM 18772]